jgi:hypothetical protein
LSQLFAMTQSAQGWRYEHGCRCVDALNPSRDRPLLASAC